MTDRSAGIWIRKFPSYYWRMKAQSYNKTLITTNIRNKNYSYYNKLHILSYSIELSSTTWSIQSNRNKENYWINKRRGCLFNKNANGHYVIWIKSTSFLQNTAKKILKKVKYEETDQLLRWCVSFLISLYHLFLSCAGIFNALYYFLL